MDAHTANKWHARSVFLFWGCLLLLGSLPFFVAWEVGMGLANPGHPSERALLFWCEMGCGTAFLALSGVAVYAGLVAWRNGAASFPWVIVPFCTATDLGLVLIAVCNLRL